MKTRTSIFLFALMTVAAVIIQSDFLSLFTVLGVKPDLILVFVALGGFYIHNIDFALYNALVAGFLASAFSEAPLLFHPVVYVAICYTGMFFRKKRMFSVSSFSELPAVLASSIIYIFFVTIYKSVDTGSITGFSFYELMQFLVYCILNLIFSLPISRFIKKFVQNRSTLFVRM